MLRQTLVHFEHKQVSPVLRAKTRPQIACSFQAAKPVVWPRQGTVHPPYQRANLTRASAGLTKPQVCPFLSISFLPLVHSVQPTPTPRAHTNPFNGPEVQNDLLVGVR